MYLYKEFITNILNDINTLSCPRKATVNELNLQCTLLVIGVCINCYRDAIKDTQRVVFGDIHSISNKISQMQLFFACFDVRRFQVCALKFVYQQSPLVQFWFCFLLVVFITMVKTSSRGGLDRQRVSFMEHII